MQKISTEEIYQHLHSPTPDDVFIDVRTKEEFEAEHIANFENIPLDSLDLKMGAFEGKNVYISCLTGNRSEKAAEKLEAHGGAKEVLVYEGGITAWKAADYETVTPKKQDNDKDVEQIELKEKFRSLPFERQILLVIGIILTPTIAMGMLGNLISGILGILIIVSIALNNTLIEDSVRRIAEDRPKGKGKKQTSDKEASDTQEE